MDDPRCDVEALADALDVLASASRRFGGHRAVLGRLDRVLRRGPAADDPPSRRLRVLDVGAGGGEIALAVHEALSRRGPAPRVVLADLHRATLELCRQRIRRADPAVREDFGFVRLDGEALPFPDRCFDLAFSTTTLHHLDETGARSFLSELHRVSRGGWIVTDLRRSRLALVTVTALAATLWRGHPFPRRDGPVSVRRSFTAGEIRRTLDELAIRPATVRPSPVRWTAWGWRGGEA